LVKNENAYVGLMLEIVATRDIAQGEEVFIDYGKEWVAAWEKHEKQWQERLSSGALPKQWPVRAVDMNAEYAEKPFLTKEEHLAKPYPQNVGLAMFMLLAQDGAQGTLADPRTWTAPSAGNSFTWEHLVEPDFLETVTPANGSFVYTVRWTTDQDEIVYVKDIPHSAFTFVDAPETSDQFTPAAFRHFIGIPDEIFPQGPWRNVE
jgi:hypothetical protein